MPHSQTLSDITLIHDIHPYLKGIRDITRNIDSYDKNIIVLEYFEFMHHLLDNDGKLKSENVDELLFKLKAKFKENSILPPTKQEIDPVYIDQNQDKISNIVGILKIIDLLERHSDDIKQGKIEVYFPEAAELSSSEIKSSDAAINRFLKEQRKAEEFIENRVDFSDSRLTSQESEILKRKSYIFLFREIKYLLALSKIIQNNPYNTNINFLGGGDHIERLKNALKLSHLNVNAEDTTKISLSFDNIDILVEGQMQLLHRYLNISSEDESVWKERLIEYNGYTIAQEENAFKDRGNEILNRAYSQNIFNMVEFYKHVSGQKMLTEEEEKIIWDYADILANIEARDMIPDSNIYCYSPSHPGSRWLEQICSNEEKRSTAKAELKAGPPTTMQTMVNNAQQKLTDKERQNRTHLDHQTNSEIGVQMNWRNQIRDAKPVNYVDNINEISNEASQAALFYENELENIRKPKRSSVCLIS